MPGFKCIYLHCLSRSGSNKSLFTLPGDPVRCYKWLTAVGREDLLGKSNRSYKLCEDHFERKCFSVSTNFAKRLYNNAIPTIFAGPKRQSEIFLKDESPRKGKILPDDQIGEDISIVDDDEDDLDEEEAEAEDLSESRIEFTIDESDENDDTTGETESFYINTGELVLSDNIKEEVEDNVYAESLDQLLITKEDLLTIVRPTKGDEIAGEHPVKEEPDSEDENEPPKKKNRLESDQISNDWDRPGPSRLATTDEPQTSIPDVIHMEQKDFALNSILTCSEDLDTFFKTISAVAKTLNPIDQVMLQKNISNAVFDMKIKEMANKKS